MILVKTEETPLIMEAKVLVVVERLLLLIEVVVETLPFTVLVNTLAEEDILLIVEEATKLVKSVVVEIPFTFEQIPYTESHSAWSPSGPAHQLRHRNHCRRFRQDQAS